MLPSATLTGVGGQLITSTMPSGFIIDTADQDSIKYSIEYANGTYSGNGRGNWTSNDLVFRWNYIDPTGGKMTTKQQIYENPFLDLPQEVTLQVLDGAGQAIGDEIKNYQGLSYRVTKEDNARLFDNAKTPELVEYSRQIGLRVVVKDNTQLTKTGTFQAVNQYPGYSKIEVVDSYQDSPYYILSGYYGNRTFTGSAVWSPDIATTIGAITTISGSGVRGLDGNLIRSESEDISLTFRDISGAFSTATFYNGTGLTSVPRAAVSINFKGTDGPDYEQYVYAYGDLIDHYKKNVNPAIPIADWGKLHYTTYGQTDTPPRQVPSNESNTLGISNLDSIADSNKTGFSGVSFTVLPENVSKGKIIFNCFNPTSNKDVYSVDVYTGLGYTEAISLANAQKDNWYEIISTGAGVNWTGIGHDSSTPLVGSEFVYNGVTVAGSFATGKQVFTPDLVNHTNKFKSVYLNETRSYLNVITLGEGLPIEKWSYFRFRPWDDYGPGFTSKVVSGYLEAEPIEASAPTYNSYNLDGGRGQDELIDVKAGSLLIKGYKYRIVDSLGDTAINWVAIGADSATLKSEFTYNGVTITGGATTPGKVKRVEIKFSLTSNLIKLTNRINPLSDSSIVLASDLPDGTFVNIVNTSLNYDLYIEDNGNLICVIRKDSSEGITRTQSRWTSDSA